MATHPRSGGLVPPSGGSLEIGKMEITLVSQWFNRGVPPSGGSLEIGKSTNVTHL